jgi:two-component system chemotaxis response regulator CheB
MEKVWLVIVDGSPVARTQLSEAFGKSRRIHVAATAKDPETAVRRIEKFRPDVMLLDPTEFPQQALALIKHLKKTDPLPVFIMAPEQDVGGRTALRALEYGARSVHVKPPDPSGYDAFARELADRIWDVAHSSLMRLGRRTAARTAQAPEVAVRRLESPGAPQRIAAIGASTGGTEAVLDILRQFPEQCPATVVVVHMPEEMFTGLYAQRLDQLCAPRVREARQGDVLRAGQVLVAPGGRHTVVRGARGEYRVSLERTAPEHFQRPAVDPLFRSLAQCAGPGAVGVLLTGMGVDGAAGLKAMRESGADTIAQDEATSVVYGMPKAAADLGAASYILPLSAVAVRVLGLCVKP